MGEEVPNPIEVLFRQIHPQSYQNGRLSTDRFKPQPNDAGFMSVDRSTLTTAEKSHSLYASMGKKSAAVYGLSVAEFLSEALKVYADPIEADGVSPANPAHAVVDYTAFDERKWKNISKRLAVFALARGALHLPPSNDDIATEHGDAFLDAVSEKAAE